MAANESTSTPDVLGKRSLPHSLEAEQSVLGALLVDIEAAESALQLLAAEDFYSPRHSKIFELFAKLYDENSALDEVMALDAMERLGLSESLGGLEFLEELVQRLPSVANVEHYSRIIREKAILRSLVGTCSEVLQGVYDSETSARAQLDVAEQKILDIGNRESGQDFAPIETLVDECFERLDSDVTADGSVLSGFADLDRMTTGFRPADFVIIAGRPSMGKTSFAMNCVENAARAAKPVAIFSLEVAKDQLVQNLLCTFAQVDAHRVRQRSLSRNEWQDLLMGAQRLREMPIFIDDTPGLTPLSVKAKARRLHKRRPLGMIVIDYLQLMEGSGSNRESRQQEISVVSRSLKGLARELQVPVVALSQLSRGVENRESHRPRLSDLRESGAIEQDADVVLLLYREEYYKPEKEEAKGKAEVIIAKQRNGPTGAVRLVFRSNIMRFEDMASHYTDDDLPV